MGLMITVPNVDIVPDSEFIMRWTQFVRSISPQLDEWEHTKHLVCTVLFSFQSEYTKIYPDVSPSCQTTEKESV
jgi:hypothetical protein